MPYRCQKCMSTFKTLSLYNRHATGPESNCKVAEIVRANKPGENKPDDGGTRPPSGQQKNGVNSGQGQQTSSPQVSGGGQQVIRQQVSGNGQHANRPQISSSSQQTNRPQVSGNSQQVNRSQLAGGGQHIIKPQGSGEDQQRTSRAQLSGVGQKQGVNIQQSSGVQSVVRTVQQSGGGQVRVGQQVIRVGQQGSPQVLRNGQSPAQVVRTNTGEVIAKGSGMVRQRQEINLGENRKRARAEITIDDDDLKGNVNRIGGGITRNTGIQNIMTSNRIVETFNCDQCPAKFDVKSRLEQHKEVHEEESRRCAVCEDDFAWPDSNHQCYYTKYKLRLIAGDIVPDF